MWSAWAWLELSVRSAHCDGHVMKPLAQEPSQVQPSGAELPVPGCLCVCGWVCAWPVISLTRNYAALPTTSRQLNAERERRAGRRRDMARLQKQGHRGDVTGLEGEEEERGRCNRMERDIIFFPQLPTIPVEREVKRASERERRRIRGRERKAKWREGLSGSRRGRVRDGDGDQKENIFQQRHLCSAAHALLSAVKTLLGLQLCMWLKMSEGLQTKLQSRVLWRF